MQALRVVVLVLAISATAVAQPVDPPPDSTVDGAVIGFTLGALPWATITALYWSDEGPPSGVEAFGQFGIMAGSGMAGALIGASWDRAKISVHDPVWDGALKGALAGSVFYLVHDRLGRRREPWISRSGEVAARLLATGGGGALIGAFVDARFTTTVRPLPGGAALSVSW